MTAGRESVRRPPKGPQGGSFPSSVSRELVVPWQVLEGTQTKAVEELTGGAVLEGVPRLLGPSYDPNQATINETTEHRTNAYAPNSLDLRLRHGLPVRDDRQSLEASRAHALDTT